MVREDALPEGFPDGGIPGPSQKKTTEKRLKDRIVFSHDLSESRGVKVMKFIVFV
jgi:hypothetical protein